MLKQSLRNLSLTKNRQLITTTKDGFGCNFRGFVWQWSAIIQTNLESVLLLQLHICLLRRRDNLPFKPWKLHLRRKRKNKLYCKRSKMFQSLRRRSLHWTRWTAHYTINWLIGKTLLTEKYLKNLSLKRTKKVKELNNYPL